MAISVYFGEANFTAKLYSEVLKRLEKAGLGLPIMAEIGYKPPTPMFSPVRNTIVGR